MPRTAREKSKTGIYHVMIRGINRQDLFEDDKDRQRFVETLEVYKEKSGYTLLGYCLMSNHIHLLLKEIEESLAVTIKRLSSSYVYYYNWKYSRCGHLFQERFKSEAVNDDRYFLTVLRYIHQNPVKAKMVNNITDHKWSSYPEYISGSIFVNTHFALQMFSEDRAKATQAFIEFHQIETNDKCLDYDLNIKIDDEKAIALIKQNANVKHLHEVQRLEKRKRDDLLKKLKSIEGLSLRQIARLTGLSYYQIQK